MNTKPKDPEKVRPRPGRRVIHETILIVWINLKLQQFEADSSAILWSGARMLSKEKFEATLGMLRVGSYMLPRLFKVTGERGRSYKVLRKWRTEKPFKALIDHLAEEYVAGFLEEYLAEARLLYEGFKSDTKDSLSRKHEAMSIRWLVRMLVEANDAWGRILYEKIFQRLPALIRKEKDPGVIGQLYMLLLVCHYRWPRKLKIDPKEGRRYHEFFRDFVVRLGQDWSGMMNGFSADVAKVYAEALLSYLLLLHGKLTGPIFKYDAPVGEFSLLSLAEQFSLRKELASSK